jgi:hypothetical protein
MGDYIFVMGCMVLGGYICYLFGYAAGAKFTLKEFDRFMDAAIQKQREKNT